MVNPGHKIFAPEIKTIINNYFLHQHLKQAFIYEQWHKINKIEI